MQPQGCRAPAVYYHFKAKEEIVLAVLEPAFVRMRAFVSSAEAALSPAESAEIAMRGLVDLTIDERQVVATLFRDPDVERIVQSHHDVRELIHRLGQMLLGPNPDARRRVAGVRSRPRTGARRPGPSAGRCRRRRSPGRACLPRPDPSRRRPGSGGHLRPAGTGLPQVQSGIPG